MFELSNVCMHVDQVQAKIEPIALWIDHVLSPYVVPMDSLGAESSAHINDLE